jgi:dolichol-phosphate mannosyltransferase
METKQTDIVLSIVATVYNDAELVPLLVDEIFKNVSLLLIPFEIILVNDFSTDSSELAIKKVCEANSSVKGVSLSRNFGQQIAISVGMRYAKGKYVVIMDGDLQNPPAEIPRLYAEIQKGYDIIYTTSKVRNTFIDRITSELFWKMLTKIFDVKIVPNQLMMKIMNQSFVEKYNSYNEINRTVEGIVVDISSNYTILETVNELRTIGKSHYTFIKRFNHMLDMLISLSNAPLNMMIHFGWIALLITLFVSIYHLIQFLFFSVPAGFTSIILSIFLFGSLTILLLGFIGKYLSAIYTEVRKRPLYNVKQTYNIEAENNNH